MKRRTMILLCTVLVSCFYAICFISFFSQDDSREQVLLVSDEDTESKKSVNQVYWIQAGVFKEESSYQKLKNDLEARGLTIYCVETNGLIRVLAEPNEDEALVDGWIEQLSLDGIECIKKSAHLNEDEQNLYLSGMIQELLEGLCAK